MDRHNSGHEKEEITSANSSDSPNAPTRERTHQTEEIQDWLIARLSNQLGLDSSDIGINEAFASFGIDSVQAISISGDLEVWLGRQLPPTLLWDYPTIQILSQHLAYPSGTGGSIAGYNESAEAPKEPIAIIGMGCRFPGASDPDEFWKLLCDGVDAITEIPADRWDVDSFYDPNLAAVGKMNSRWGGFITNVDKFDAQFFGISPREAARMDPQQRILLEVAWEALEDAGQVPAMLAGSRTGVFIGIGTIDYGRMQIGNLKTCSNAYAGTGGAVSIAANRISYVLNLRGPSISVDTACSSSLVATHLACQSLWNSEATLALAGGVNLILDPKPSVTLSKGGFLSPDGRCRAFDSGANGYVRAEGVGIVVLKRLGEALKDGDPIYGLIRGSSINQDGHSNGLTAPNQQAQELLLRDAYRRAGISPGDVQYVETHGTGTSLGDPIEVKALGTVLGIDRTAGQPLAIGSVKTNIGHAETAAGIASLIKVALMLKHRSIPASLHFKEPNPHIPFDTLPLYVQESLGSWPEDRGPVIAGVSGFGFGGTNAHLVLSEAPSVTGNRCEKHHEPGRAHLLTLSARSPEALRDLASDYLELAVEGSAQLELEDVCYTSSIRRGHYDHRLALVARSWEEVQDRLEAFLKNEPRSGMSFRRRVPGRRPKLSFVFSGQGSQRWDMGRLLMEQEPVFRTKVEQCDELFRGHSGWSLIEQLRSDESSSRIDETEVTQPAIFMLQVGLASLLSSWGIIPDAVIGHSMGEIAAAHASGALTLEDAVCAIFHRGRLMQLTAGQGGTAALGMSLDDAKEMLAGHLDRVSIAAHNSPKSTVISGDPEALGEVLDLLKKRDVFCQQLRVNHAFHSPQMDRLLPELEQSLKGIQPGANSVPFFSTVTSGLMDGRNLTPAYWSRNLREPVLFSDTIGMMLEDGYEVFLELSPHPVLVGAISRCISDKGFDGTALSSLRREEDERAMMLGALGAIHTTGYAVNWGAIYEESHSCVQLPHYPFQRERFWLEMEDLIADSSWEHALEGRHPLLGRHLEAAQHRGTHFWESDLSSRLLPYLVDHKLQGASLLPGTAYVEMALAASTEVFEGSPFALTDIELKKALFLSEAGTHTIQTIFYPGAAGQAHFRIYSCPKGDATQDSWSLHATGHACSEKDREAPLLHELSSPDEIRGRCTGEISGTDYYSALQSRGFDYGPAFQGIERIWYQQGEAFGQVRVPQSLEADLRSYQLHPAILDACMHVLGAVTNPLAADGAGGLYIPVGFDQIRVFEPTGQQFWSHAKLREGTNVDPNILEGDVRLLDDAGRVMAEALGVRCTRLGGAAAREAEKSIRDSLYEIQWQPMPRSNEGTVKFEGEPGVWLIFSDHGGVGAKLKNLLEDRGDSCVMVSPGDGFERLSRREFQVCPGLAEDFLELFKNLSDFEHQAYRGIVHLWNLDVAPPEEKPGYSWEPSIELGCISLLHLVQALGESRWSKSNSFWMVSKGAQDIGTNLTPASIFQSPGYGLGGVIAFEAPHLGCTRIDLDPEGNTDVHQLLHELLLRENESQVAFRNLERYVPRLARYSSAIAESDSSLSSDNANRLELPDTEAFSLEISPPYVLDNLELRPSIRRKPGRGEVEIQVLAAGLNFRDVLKAMGLYPGIINSEVRLGDECSGRIVGVGEDVEEYRVGDEVIAIANNGFSSFVTVDIHFVVPKPANISFEEAATMPVAFSTAYYALCHIGRLINGERVLIHAAAGGVGLAAVSLAQSVGAEVFATAGSHEKREYLRSLRVQHVMNSRSMDWAQEVMRLTNNEGLDMVLNSLAGGAIEAGLATLRAFGRFVEIGKIDIYENNQLGLYPFRNNVAFSAIDMEQVLLNRPDLSQSMLREMVRRLQYGELNPLPHTTFSIKDSAGAFRYMAQRKNTGKIVISFEQASDHDSHGHILSDCTYLITGGLGGLGLKVAQYLVRSGARNLALIGRNSPSAKASEALGSMREAGATIMIGQADVAEADQLASVMADFAVKLPPVKGIVHAAGVLDDGILLQLDRDRFYKVLRPKIAGAWNLHSQTSEMNLDFFMLFSSAATIFSNPGQGNYVAANAFLDALAHYRRAKGLSALSINWGPWTEVGMASHLNQERLEARGMGSITPEKGVHAFEMLIDHPSAQVAVMPINWTKWTRLSSASTISSFLSLLIDGATQSTAGETPSTGHINRNSILNANASERPQLLEEYLRDAGGRVLGLAASKIDVQQPLNRLGVDSLMAVELKNRIEADLAVDVPVLKVIEGASLRELASFLLERLVPRREELPTIS